MLRGLTEGSALVLVTCLRPEGALLLRHDLTSVVFLLLSASGRSLLETTVIITNLDVPIF